MKYVTQKKRLQKRKKEATKDDLKYVTKKKRPQKKFRGMM